MRIPSFYNSDRSQLFDEDDALIPRCVVEESMQYWRSCYSPLVIPEGWSNDWENNEFLQEWLAPKSLWGITDYDLSGESYWIILIRTRLMILGDIIPVIYYKESHDFVIFRVGNRGYYFCDMMDDADDLYHIGSLLIDFERPLDPWYLNEVANNRRRGDLDFRFGDVGMRRFRSHCITTSWLLEYVKTDEGKDLKRRWSISDNPKEWGFDDWKRLKQGCRELEVRYFSQIGDPE